MFPFTDTQVIETVTALLAEGSERVTPDEVLERLDSGHLERNRLAGVTIDYAYPSIFNIFIKARNTGELVVEGDEDRNEIYAVAAPAGAGAA